MVTKSHQAIRLLGPCYDRNCYTNYHGMTMVPQLSYLMMDGVTVAI